MIIFVWEADINCGARSHSFSCQESAWEYFGELTFNDFPHYILHILKECRSYDGQPTVKCMNWSQFIDQFGKPDNAA